MAEFKTDALSCRVKRAVRLYASVYDTDPASIVIPAGAIFTSEKQYISDRISFVNITAGDEEFTGYWCPLSAIQSRTLKIDPVPSGYSEDGLTIVRKTLVIKGTGAKVYKTWDASAGISAGVKLGDELTVTRSATTIVNGQSSERYLISDTTAEDRTIIGQWIALDRNVADTSTSVPAVRQPVRKLAVARNSTTRTATVNATTAGSTTGGYWTYVDDNNVTHKIPIEEYKPVGESISSNTATNSEDDAYIASAFQRFGRLYDSLTTSYMGVPIGRMLFVHGMPFQYTHLTDRRNGVYRNFSKPSSGTGADTGSKPNNVTSSTGSQDQYGRSFAKEIAYNLPIAVLTAGKPTFMKPVTSNLFGINLGASNNTRNTVYSTLFNSADTMISGALERIDRIGGEYQYYSLEIDETDYYKHVNSECWATAVLMSIEKMQYHGTTIEKFDWSTYNSDVSQDFTTLEQVVGKGGGVAFAFDPQSSFSNTIQNSSNQSSFVDLFNGFSSKARELQFITGYMGTGLDKLQDNLDEQASTIYGNSGLGAGFENAFSRIKAWLGNTAKGMNMRFPDIWSDSAHMPSYEMDMHFITPYATPFCIWRYVLVPFFHLFVLAAPQSNTNSSQYSSPFLIKCYSKGYFNVEMGIIESFTWKRFGDGDMISENGMPTQIDVSITFKDMYHTLAITHTGETGVENLSNFINNAGLMEMIGTMTGVNMSRVGYNERYALFLSSARTMFNTLGGNLRMQINDSIRNTLRNFGFNNIR